MSPAQTRRHRDTVHRLDPGAAATMMYFSASGGQLTVSNTDGCFLWQTGAWDVATKHSWSADSPGAIAFSPDNQLIVMPHDRFSLALADGETLDEGDRRLASWLDRDSRPD